MAIPVATFSTSIANCDGEPVVSLLYQDGANAGLKLHLDMEEYIDAGNLWLILQKLDLEASEGDIGGILSWSEEKIVLSDSCEERRLSAEIPATNANLSSLRQALTELRTQYPPPHYGQCSRCYGYRYWLEQRHSPKQLERWAEWDYQYLPDRQIWLALSCEEQDKWDSLAARCCSHAVCFTTVSSGSKVMCRHCSGFRSYRKEKRAAGQSLLEIYEGWREMSWKNDAVAAYLRNDVSSCPHSRVQLAKEQKDLPAMSDVEIDAALTVGYHEHRYASSE